MKVLSPTLPIVYLAVKSFFYIGEQKQYTKVAPPSINENELNSLFVQLKVRSIYIFNEIINKTGWFKKDKITDNNKKE